jgi:hypothetical protein
MQLWAAKARTPRRAREHLLPSEIVRVGCRDPVHVRPIGGAGSYWRCPQKWTGLVGGGPLVGVVGRGELQGQHLARPVDVRLGRPHVTEMADLLDELGDGLSVPHS